MSYREFKNFINGEFVNSVSGRFFENRNPSNVSRVLGLFPLSVKEDVDRAVAASKKAFKAWSCVSAPERGEVLFKIGQIMASRKKELAKVISHENGKTVKSALGDVQSGIDMAFYIAGDGRRWYGKTSHSALKQHFVIDRKSV